VRDQNTFFWTYLDRPADGMIYLTWQPLEVMGTAFSTDGYIWPSAEVAYSMEVEGGYVYCPLTAVSTTSITNQAL
jgi:hypothetical protein